MKLVNESLKEKDIFVICKLFIEKFNLTQFITFCMVGTVGFTFNYSIFFVMYRYFHIYYLISSATGFILAIFVAFFLNKKYTFKLRSNIGIKTIAIKYFSVNIFSVTLGMISLTILVEIFKINVYISNVLIIGLVAISNFTGSRLFAFRIKEKKK